MSKDAFEVGRIQAREERAAALAKQEESRNLAARKLELTKSIFLLLCPKVRKLGFDIWQDDLSAPNVLIGYSKLSPSHEARISINVVSIDPTRFSIKHRVGDDVTYPRVISDLDSLVAYVGRYCEQNLISCERYHKNVKETEKQNNKAQAKYLREQEKLRSREFWKKNWLRILLVALLFVAFLISRA